jgi:hypothetical protein
MKTLKDAADFLIWTFGFWYGVRHLLALATSEEEAVAWIEFLHQEADR